MTAIETMLQEPITRAVGWALLHFLWQGALVGALTAAALHALRRSAADVRYVVSTIALALMATMPVVTVAQAWLSAGGQAVVLSDPLQMSTATSPVAARRLTADAERQPRAAAAPRDSAMLTIAPAALERWLPFFVLAWMAGVAILAARLIGGWLWVQRMTSHGVVPPDAALQAMLGRLTKKLHIGRSVSLLQSSGVDVPTVIGWLRPTVLLPLSAMSGLSPLQVEAILAHELAHVRRHDYLVNLLQSLVETLLFYHPAVWWVSRRIRIERENCCDDLAVSLCGDPVVYARALADLEESRGPRTQLVMAATGGDLLERVRRLLAGPTTHAGRGPAWVAAVAALVLMVGIAGSALAPAPPRETADHRATAAGWDHLRITIGRTIHYFQNAFGSGRRLQGPAPKPPQPPTPPTPPAAPADDATGSKDASGNFSWRRGGDQLDVTYRGSFDLNDTDSDIIRISPGGYVKISDGRWLRGHSAEISADGAGKITRRFYVGMNERPFESEGREWLAAVLPRFVRSSGFAAEARVARFLRSGGIDGVLAEISHIEGAYGKKVYFTELLRTAAVDAAAARKIVTQAGREIDSDHELGTLLIDGAGKLLSDAASQAAYLEAAKNIDSDYEMRRVLQAVLDVVRAPEMDGALRDPFFQALGEIDSSYEKGLVLQALLRRGTVSPATLMDVLREVGGMSSGYEASQVLRTAARTQTIEGAARDAYIRAAERLGDYEQSQALAALKR